MQKNSTKESLEIRFNNRQLIPFLTGISLFIGVFIGGLFVWVVGGSRSDNEKSFSNSNQEINEFYDVKYIDGIFNLLKSKHLGDLDSISEEEYTQGLVKGLIESLGDRYTMYFTPEEAEQYLAQASGDFEGIGVTLGFDGQYTFVESVLKDHPAEKAGIMAGDIILEVDNEVVVDILPAIVAQKIRGEGGTEVKLALFRGSESVSDQAGELEISVVRGLIKIDNIFWEKVDDNTVVIEIIQFNDSSVKEFNDTWDRIVKEITEQVPNVDNIVVDLRGNPGGYVFSVKYVLEEFLTDGKILMKEKTKGEDEEVFKDNRKGKFEDKNLVVIVDEGSASASEIFASAIQDNDRGKVVGEKTVGKGVEQQVIDLPDGGLLLIVFQQWLTPKGRNIDAENPITPDVEVEYTFENFKNNTDPQLDKALELLTK